MQRGGNMGFNGPAEECKHEWMRMQYAEEEFKCVKCGETRPEVYEEERGKINE